MSLRQIETGSFENKTVALLVNVAGGPQRGMVPMTFLTTRRPEKLTVASETLVEAELRD
jgi:hypothetical protein